MELIHQKISQALQPEVLAVEDESHFHVGHPGAASGAGHFAVTIKSSKFNGLSKIKAHQLIYAAVKDMMETEIHALKIKIQ